MPKGWFEATWEETCAICKGAGTIKGSRNWVAQGFAEAACFHCGTSGKVTVSACVTESQP